MPYLVSVGKRLTKNDKLRYFWLLVTDKQGQALRGDGLDGKEAVCLTGPKDIIKGSPGEVFFVEKTDEGYNLGTAKHAGYWKNQDQKLAWAGLERSNIAEYERLRNLKNATGYDNVLESLDPARRAYAKLMGSHRPHFLAMVVDYITRSAL